VSPGDELYATDGEGKRFRAQVSTVDRNRIVAEIQDHTEQDQQTPQVILAISPTKQRQRLETAVEKAVELGADEIVLMQSARTERTKIRMDRLETILITALKQSLRVWKPILRPLISIDQLLEKEQGRKWLAHEAVAKNQPTGFTSMQQEQFKEAERNLLLVGPEGGFTEDEVASARNKGAEVISLGTHRLRAETAALAFLSLTLPLRQ
jgi:16S rRNA (uracil1498-N3)-methyltransferase